MKIHSKVKWAEMKCVHVLHVAKIFEQKQQANERTAPLNVQESMIIKEKTRLSA